MDDIEEVIRIEGKMTPDFLHAIAEEINEEKARERRVELNKLVAYEMPRVEKRMLESARQGSYTCSHYIIDNEDLLKAVCDMLISNGYTASVQSSNHGRFIRISW